METNKRGSEYGFDSTLSHTLPNVPGLLDYNGFLLALPPMIELATSGGTFSVEPKEVLGSEGNLYDVVTDVNDYDRAMRDFLNSSKFVMHPSANVLVAYYVEEYKVYTTLPLRIVLTKKDAIGEIGNDMTTSSQFVVQFKDFTKETK